MDACGRAMERPLVLGGDLLDGYRDVRALAAAAQGTFDAGHDLEMALAALQAPLEALRENASNRIITPAAAAPDPLRRAFPPPPPSSAELLFEDAAEAERTVKGLLVVVRDARDRVRVKLRAALDTAVPALEQRIAAAEQAIRAQVLAAVDDAIATGRLVVNLNRLAGELPMLANHRADLMDLRKTREALTRT
jgi:hypothetical protein